ncbi:MAG: 4Fe-4S binding protein [Clostridia bacterium]|nr:4Fe-4S binding protein [Clostridia bacterium]
MKIAVLIIIAVALALRIYVSLPQKKKKSDTKNGALCAQVMCGGTNALARRKYNYDGVTDCKTASLLYGGPKLCTYGCVGMGTCAAACPENAINIIGGVAAVDRSKCTACGKCISACPKGIIKLVPKKDTYWVGCSSKAGERETAAFCKMGCIACGECASTCPLGAISIIDNHAVIDNSLCDACGKCAEVCPKSTVWKS